MDTEERGKDVEIQYEYTIVNIKSNCKTAGMRRNSSLFARLFNNNKAKRKKEIFQQPYVYNTGFL